LKFLAIIAARMGSTRFPGKVLAPIGGIPVLKMVTRRLSSSAKLENILVATSDMQRDDAIEHACREEGIEYFRGSENDVLGRYVVAAKGPMDRRIVRVTADCPFVSGETLDPVLEQCELNPDCALVTTKPDYPRGIDYEIVPFSILSEIDKRATEPSDREHIFNFIYGQPHEFKILRLPCPNTLIKVQREFLLDTPEDLSSFEKALGSQSPLYARPEDMQ
jgi:spore coat polysaccharide biosynthesis protein SpsF (cytidylyltransferase family)